MSSTASLFKDDEYLCFMKDFYLSQSDGSFRVKFDRQISRIDSISRRLVTITRNIEEKNLNSVSSIKIWIENGGGSIEGLCSQWCKTLISNNAVDDISLLLPVSLFRDNKKSHLLINSINRFANVMNKFFMNPYQILELGAKAQQELLASFGNATPAQPADDSISHVFVDFHKHHSDELDGSSQQSLHSTRNNTVDIIVFSDPNHFTAESLASHANIEESKAVAAINEFHKDRQLSDVDKKTHTECEEFIFKFVQINAIFQLILDIVLEVLHLIPRRINHLSLTLINAFLAYKTLSAIKQNKFRFLHEDIQILFVLEVVLIFGDIFVIWDRPCWPKGSNLLTFFAFRAVFLFLSSINGIMSLYIMHKYKLYHCYYVGDVTTEDLLSKTLAMPPMLLISGKKKTKKNKKQKAITLGNENYSNNDNDNDNNDTISGVSSNNPRNVYVAPSPDEPHEPINVNDNDGEQLKCRNNNLSTNNDVGSDSKVIDVNPTVNNNAQVEQPVPIPGPVITSNEDNQDNQDNQNGVNGEEIKNDDADKQNEI